MICEDQFVQIDGFWYLLAYEAFNINAIHYPKTSYKLLEDEIRKWKAAQ